MRSIVHLSDLHFGRVDAGLLEPLRKRVVALAPHVVVVSGDLTQRAKPAQFREARAFLDTLPANQVVVPGNHDVPLYNVFQRFVRAKYLPCPRIGLPVVAPRRFSFGFSAKKP